MIYIRWKTVGSILNTLFTQRDSEGGLETMLFVSSTYSPYTPLMMTPWHGNALYMTSHLWRESGDRFPSQ